VFLASRDFTRVFAPLRTWQLPAKFGRGDASRRIQIDSLPIALASRGYDQSGRASARRNEGQPFVILRCG
jgi:hypothetical protein